MRWLRVVAVAVLMVAVTGCAASYNERMKYLDDMANRGVAYREKLQQQHTEPSREACKLGYDQIKEQPPLDENLGPSEVWRKQVEEAFIKSCMTGEKRPKPDPSGVDAVTPSPNATSTDSPSTAPSRP